MEDTRREFIKKALLLSGAAGMSTMLPPSIQRALAIDPQPGSTYLDAEHVVILMQENRSFDHCFGTLRGVRGFNDPRAINLPNNNPVWLQSNKKGETYAPFRMDIKNSKVTWMGALPHGRHDQVDAGNGGKHDQWLETKKSRRKKEYGELPLTLGYFNREDIPFNYAFADAFTVCDYNFCSVNTSTQPNRLYLMSGAIRDPKNDESEALVRNDAVKIREKNWKTFPEVLAENNIEWKVYQNEISAGGGFKEEEKLWLSNFGCNILERFPRFHVKFNARSIRSAQKRTEVLPTEIKVLKDNLTTLRPQDANYSKIKSAIEAKQKVLDEAYEDLQKYSADNFKKLSDYDKDLYHRAFTNNSGDPDYRKLTSLTYDDGGQQRQLQVPKGDVLYQFRKDVNDGTLPTVSWIVSPQNFCDHPSSPWYGAWYVSEILDILTKNPEVWKKTIFILTYDENDGYFDHIPPFVPPTPVNPNSGKVSEGINIDTEFVKLDSELKAGIDPKAAREAPIGLGYRVPMVIASPWSRGGKVCSEVFDHTSPLQFLEGFLSKKTGKSIQCDNISKWRRTICGDLTSVFKTYNPDVKKQEISFLSRDGQIEAIHKAQFKDVPSGFKAVSKEDIEKIKQGDQLPFMPKQEPGVRTACALPYQLQVSGKLTADKKAFEINLHAGNEVFGERSAGSPFKVYAPGNYRDKTSKKGFETTKSWDYAVIPEDTLRDEWALDSFEKQQYHLRVYGPNGFYREFKGDAQDPDMALVVDNELDLKTKKPTGNILLRIENLDPNKEYSVSVADNAYKTAGIQQKITPKGSESITLNLKKSFGWYDFTVRVAGSDIFEQRFTGHVETGEDTFTDPFMGRMI